MSAGFVLTVARWAGILHGHVVTPFARDVTDEHKRCQPKETHMTQVPPVAPQPEPVPAAPAPAKRPGGLTALAVLNFVFGGFGVIGGLAGLAGVAALQALRSAAESATDEAGRAAMAQIPGAGIMYVLLLLGLVSSALLIASGIGYLKLKKGLGLKVGSIYGILGIVTTVLNLVLYSSSFGFMSILGLVYPVLTLILLNKTFKSAFVNA
jgi:hypothetical protein